MIKTVISLDKNKVIVFSGSNKEIQENQGKMKYVRDKILAESGERFASNHWFGDRLISHIVNRDCR